MECYDDFFPDFNIVLFNKYEQYISLMELIFLNPFTALPLAVLVMKNASYTPLPRSC